MTTAPAGVMGQALAEDRRGRWARKSDRQALAAFGAAGVDHRATTACFHANEKTVGAGALDLGRLVGAFHGIRIWIGETRDYRKETPTAASTRPDTLPNHLP